MAKVKLPLEMANGVMARTIEELRDNFDMKKVVGHFLDGKLKKWLEVRYYEEELEKINELSESDPELAEKLCDIFGVEYNDEKFDVEVIQEENERLLRLKQYTDDEEIIANIGSVAFDQEELADLYDKGIEKIYLCEGVFSIPESKQELEYIEIGKVKYSNGFRGNLLNLKKIEEIRDCCFKLLNDLLESQVKVKKEEEKFTLCTEGVLISGNITSRYEAERRTKEFLATAYNKRESAVKGMAIRLANQCKYYSCYVKDEGNFYFKKLKQANNVIMQCNNLLKEVKNISSDVVPLINLMPKDLSIESIDSLIFELCDDVVRYDNCYSLDSYVNYVDIESTYAGSGFFGDKYKYRICNVFSAVEEMERDLRNNFYSFQCDKYIENANSFIEKLNEEINKRKEFVSDYCTVN